MKRLSILSLCVAVVAGMLSACGPAAVQRVQSSSFGDVPAWVDNAPELCAIGSARFRGSRSMVRTTAIERARGQLAAALQTSVRKMFEDYQAQGGINTESGEGEKSFSEEQSEQAQRNLVKDLTLSGSTVKGTFLTQEVPREFYAMVCAEPEVLSKVIEKNNQLGAQAREFLNKRARTLKNKMDEMVEKRQ